MAQKRKTKITGRQADHPLVAVDIGSSGIRVMAAEEKDGRLHILGYESIQKYGFVEKGIVTQTTEVGMQLSRLLHLLNNRIGRNESQPLDRVFVTVGGKLLQVCDVSVKRNLISRNYISPKLKEDMEQECRDKIEGKYQQMKVMGITPIRYALDAIEQIDEPAPTQKAKEVEVLYNVFVGKREAEEKTVAGIARSNRDIEEIWVRPEALVTALVGEEEERQGVAIIDFGAHTTTLTIFKQGKYLRNHVIPLGGYNITKDLQAQRIDFSSAERLKTQFGVAAEKFVRKSQTFSIRSTDQTDERVMLTTDIVARMIQLRLNEITAPIMQEINSLQDEIGYVYVTGEGSLLQELIPYLQEQTVVKVDYGSHAEWLEPDAPEEYYHPRYASLVGTLALAADFRRHHSEGEVKIPKSFLEKAKEKVIDIFSQQDGGYAG